jgi:leucyl/phenylalanyl-tRNA--protein transferase
MVIAEFPPIDFADETGMIAVGGDLEVDSLLLAYRSGIFPWPVSVNHPMAWFSPDPRGILKLNDFHVSKSFQKFLKSTDWHIKFNCNFAEVIQRCAFADNRKDQEGTWITPYVIKSYIDFHKAGHAFSVETYSGNNLVGGMYGVKIGRYVAGESMFFLKSNASKFAFYYFINKLREHNIEWIDTQMVTPLTKSMGAIEIPRTDFLLMHKKEITKESFNF